MGLGLLADGKWISEREQEDKQGKFIRPSTTFRHQITADGSSGFKAEPNRYHLYISWACPWAQRTAILRQLKGLEDVISLSAVAPEIDQNGWEFSQDLDCIDSVNHTNYLWEVYLKAEPDYSGRVTVPVLWDKQTATIVNNESREIIRMLDTEFEEFATKKEANFYPTDLQTRIDQIIDTIYQPINNGVYRAGFATTQSAYEEAVTELFAALDHWEEVLTGQRYLCGDRLTEADWCMFTTLLRFDAVYYVHFKCNLRRIVDYPNLWNYLKDLYQQKGVKETCNLDHIKRHYYKSHPKVNPTRIVPKGPIIDFDAPHNRYRMGATTAVGS